MPLRSKALDAVDWASLTDGYGRPGEIPALLRAVWSRDPRARRETYDALVRHLVHQGSRYDSSVAAVPFLIDVVADRRAPDRFAACQVLTAVAIGDESYWWAEWPDPAVTRRDIERKVAMSLEELERDWAVWVAAAPTEEVRRAREGATLYVDLETRRRADRWNVEAYDAVRAGMPVYVAALKSKDPAVRLWTSYLVAWFPEERDTIVPALIRVIREDRYPEIAATASVAAGLCGAAGDAALIEALSRRRAGKNRAERWSAVLGLARVVPEPDRALLEDLLECLFGATGPVPNWPFLGGDMAGVAASMIARLGGDTAAERVEILAGRLGHEPAVSDPYVLVEALLEAAFPDGGGAVPAGGFAELSDVQRVAVRALDRPVVWDEGAMMSMLLDKYGLPGDVAALRRWMS